jgi:hypothetical protein
MIPGVRASSLVFSDFEAVSGVMTTNLSRKLPGIDAAGHAVKFHGAKFTMRLGPMRKQKRDLIAHLHIGSAKVPSQAALMGTLTLREDAIRSRTKVSFEGTCSRNFDGLDLSSAASTEAVLHQANDFCRVLLEVLVKAIEATPSSAPRRVAAKRVAN